MNKDTSDRYHHSQHKPLSIIVNMVDTRVIIDITMNRDIVRFL